ncbi:hypothetical protein [Intestinibacter bartlettii]|uniref:hypothetical protein n=1 Tax=Intestinibacter bartlettii TaxID=261299 RepID=UPI00082104D1|nr:hypothetical protein [Intestinibacter bartlettii]SCI52246.1 Uncharacterised protein [uncultured Clostridium sp.]
MIKANVKDGEVTVILDGTIDDVMGDLCMLNDTVIKELERKSGIPADKFLNLITGAIKLGLKENRIKEKLDIKEDISDSISKDIFNDIR